jgi:hypothetical protein
MFDALDFIVFDSVYHSGGGELLIYWKNGQKVLSLHWKSDKD